MITYALHVPEREIDEALLKKGEERASAMEYALQVTYIGLWYLYSTMHCCQAALLRNSSTVQEKSLNSENTSNKASNLESKKTTACNETLR